MLKRKATARGCTGCEAFARDEGGAMTIYLLIMSILMFGILGLLIDTSRSFIAHTQMQDYIDDIALAAANELDGEADAITRAQAVIDSALLSKSTSLGVTGGEYGVGNIYYLKGAPRSTGSTLRLEDFADLITTDATLATHVVIASANQAVSWGLLNITVSGNTSSDPRPAAEKSAGSTPINTWAAATLVRERYCVEPEIVACAPASVDMSSLQAGTQLRLVKNREGNWQPGEYGLPTDAADDQYGTCEAYSGNAKLECLLAIDTHNTTCGDPIVSFSGDPMQDVAYTVGGTTTIVSEDSLHVNRGINPRFGIFDPDAASYQQSGNVSIDANHVSGKPYTCDGTVQDASSETQGLPRDECFDDGTCDVVSTNPVSETALKLYWEKAHGTSNLPRNEDGERISTRYEAYLYELRNGLINPEDSSSAVGPRAQCHPNTSVTDADVKGNRRLLEVAFVDCSGLDGVVATEVPVETYVSAFVTDPVEFTDYFVATFDDVVELNPGSGEGDEPNGGEAVAMQGGDIITEGIDVGDMMGGKPSYDPYAAQGLKVYALADRNGSTPSLSVDLAGGDECHTGGYCANYNSKDFKLTGSKANEDALTFLESLGLDDIEEIAVDESSGFSSTFDAGSIGATSGTWTSDEPVQLLVFKAANEFSVVVYETPRTEGTWDNEALLLQNGGGNVPALSNLRAYSFDGEVPPSNPTTGRFRGYNFPMLLNSQGDPDELDDLADQGLGSYDSGWEGDPDLKSVDMGNVVIIPECFKRNTSGCRAGRQDDHGGGGMLIFQFDVPTEVGSVVFFDGEERHSKIKIYKDKIDVSGVGRMDDPRDLDDLYPADLTLDVPVIGDGKHRTFYIKDHPEYVAAEGGAIPAEGIQTLIYHMEGSGAIDEISFRNALTEGDSETVVNEEEHYDELMLEFVGTIDEGDSRVVSFPIISN